MTGLSSLESTELGLDAGLLPLNPLFSSLSFYYLSFIFNNHYKNDIAPLQRAVYFADIGEKGEALFVPEIIFFRF